MPGWNLKKGILVEENLSDDEYWSLFNYVFSDSCKKTNTYKFGLIKSVCDQVYCLVESDYGYFISYEHIFEKFAENYWNLVLRYGIKQMAYNGKSEYSKVETVILGTKDKYGIPSETPFSSINSVDRKQIINEVTKECKKCVIGALYNDFEGKLYSFSLKGEGIILSRGAYSFIARHKMEIEKLNYYSWARYLEKINDDSVSVRLLEKLDLSTPQRKDLSLYREVLYKEFQDDRCFYCGKKLGNVKHVDHFIPWSFVKTDNLWNFVLACPKCNILKSNQLANVDYIKKIDERNSILIETMKESSFVKREFTGYYSGLIDQLWTYAKLSGMKEKQYSIDREDANV